MRAKSRYIACFVCLLGSVSFGTFFMLSSTFYLGPAATKLQMLAIATLIYILSFVCLIDVILDRSKLKKIKQ